MAIYPTCTAEDWIEDCSAGLPAGDAFVSGWIEGEKGSGLQVGNNPVGCRRADLLDRIADARLDPKGYVAPRRVMA